MPRGVSGLAGGRQVNAKAMSVRRYRSPASTPRRGWALRTPLRAYAALAGVTVLNPLTMVYWAALVLGRQASAAALTPAQAGAFVAAVFTASPSGSSSLSPAEHWPAGWPAAGAACWPSPWHPAC